MLLEHFITLLIGPLIHLSILDGLLLATSACPLFHPRLAICRLFDVNEAVARACAAFFHFLGRYKILSLFIGVN